MKLPMLSAAVLMYIERCVMISESDLRANVKPGRLKHIYLLVGNDPYLTKNYAEKIAKVTVGENADLNLFSLPESADVQMIYDSIMQFSFTGDKICVSVCNYNFDDCHLSEFKKLISVIEQAPENNVLIFYYDVLQINTKKSERFKKLAAVVEKVHGVVCELNHKTENELIKILGDSAAKRGVRLDQQTARYMISVCSNDLNILINELEKLTAFVGKDGIAGVDDVDKVCVKTLEASVYDLSKHIINGRGEKALNLLNNLLYNGVSPAEIHALIVNTYVDFYRVKSAVAKGIKSETIAKEFGYAPNRAFVLSNAERDARRLSVEQLGEILNELLKSDALVKNDVKLSGDSARTALECLVTKIIRISGGIK